MFQFTISHWGVLPDGVKPVKVVNFLDDNVPGSYMETHFWFQSPPVREDVMALGHHEMWLRCWDEELLSAMKNSQFPYLRSYYKSSECAIRTEAGVVIGKWGISLQRCYLNPITVVPSTDSVLASKLIRRLPKDVQDTASRVLEDNCYLIIERLMNLGRSYTEADERKIMRKVLAEYGVIK